MKMPTVPDRQHQARITGTVLLLTAMYSGASEVEERHWETSAGGGVYSSSAYAGSSERYQAALPWFESRYSNGSVALSLSVLDGAELAYFDEDHGLYLSLTVNGGDSRDSTHYTAVLSRKSYSQHSRELLQGTPRVSNPVYSELQLAALTPVGLAGISLGYYPSLTGESSGRRTEHGFLLSLNYMLEYPWTDRLRAGGMLSLSAMNSAYARAWYSLPEDTTRLSAYRAEAGLQNLQAALQLTYMLTDYAGVSLLGAETLLLSDAAGSPYSETQNQTTLALYTFFRF